MFSKILRSNTKLLTSLPSKAFYSTNGKYFAEAAAASGAVEFKINFCTPHETIFGNAVVDQVVLPGAAGEYGVTAGHSPIISQLEPGVVSVYTNGEVVKYFIPGGFAITKSDSTTDISVPEAVLVSDLDEAAIKSGFSAAQSTVSSSAEGSVEKASAMIEVGVFSAMARAAGVSI